MIITGYIYGVKNKLALPLPGVSYRVYSKQYNEASETDVTNAEGFFQIGVEGNYPDAVLQVLPSPILEQNHLETYSFPLSDLQDGVTLYLYEKGVNPIVLAAFAGAAALLILRKKKIKKVSGIDAKQVLLIGGGVVGISILSKILTGLGIWKSADSRELDNASTNPNSFWSPNFWHNKPADVSWTYALSAAEAKQYASQIYDAFGFFNDCEECAIGVFKLLRTKANVSYIAEAFQLMYGQDLLTFLRGGSWPQDRLSDSDVATINSYVKNLPDY